jgi:hypothetical protein
MRFDTEQVGLAVTLWICIQEVHGSQSLFWDTGCHNLTEFLFFYVLLPSPYSHRPDITSIGHDRFLANPFQFIIHQSPFDAVWSRY